MTATRCEILLLDEALSSPLFIPTGAGRGPRVSLRGGASGFHCVFVNLVAVGVSWPSGRVREGVKLLVDGLSTKKSLSARSVVWLPPRRGWICSMRPVKIRPLYWPPGFVGSVRDGARFLLSCVASRHR